MTLGDAKRKVLMLLDEYSTGGEVSADEDISLKMNDFFDMAQKDMAGYVPIIKSQEVEFEGEDIELPAGFRKYLRVWNGDEVARPFDIRAGKMMARGTTGEFLIEYIADPTTINKNTPDSYAFEVPEDAANCLPFYVAAQQLITDLVIDYGAFWNMYLQARSLVDTGVPGKARIEQRFYR